jgi:hypothetical protein
VTRKAQFEYSWCLVRSRYPGDIRKGITLLEDLYNNGSEDGRRDYLYYLAIGNARIRVGKFIPENVHSLSSFVNFVCSISITVVECIITGLW